jgi:ABC-type lipoprotein export system ATPase subunit
MNTETLSPSRPIAGTGAHPVPGEVLIEAVNLHRSFDEGAVQALQGVDLCVREREFVAIQGPSGCGKSTLLQILGALDDPTQGDIRFHGRSLRDIEDRALFRARTIGFVFQSFHLLPTLSAIENVQIPMVEMPWPQRHRRERAAQLLAAVGLAGRADHLPAKLSGGERQRVAVARSLANEPAVLLADEPTGNLDSASAGRIMELFARIHQERGMTLIVVTHDPNVAQHAGRIVHILDGKVVSDTLR